jgi:hypothetical protein
MASIAVLQWRSFSESEQQAGARQAAELQNLMTSTE